MDPAVNVKKIFKLPASVGAALLMGKNGKGMIEDLAESAMGIFDTDLKSMPPMM
ncbi:MAG TPA: hypothetical protein VL087_08420 [Nitrospirota bacterium]|nr:hypothetical protein [Nitrospirota bacterium]